MSFRRSVISCLALVPALIAYASNARAQTEPAPAPSPAPAPAPAPTTAPAAAPTEAEKAPTSTDKGSLIPAESTPDKSKDAAALKGQGETAPAAAKDDKAAAGSVFSDEWWTHTRPLIEFHGFFRTRGEVFHNFSLGRIDDSNSKANLFPRPGHDTYTDLRGDTHVVNGCGPSDNPMSKTCSDKTHSSANLRFRIDPEIHISDNLRIMSQIDFLDNLVLGSTPEGYTNQPGAAGGYESTGRAGYVPLKAFSTSQQPPVAGINSYQDSVAVKRVWAEFNTPVGQLRFGRMPNNWGLGILVNSGDKIDSDYQSHADRILFVTGSKALDLYAGGAWDFPNSGRTSARVTDQQGQPYNLSQYENTHQWVLTVFRRVRPDIMRARLAKGDTIFNGGFWGVYRQQLFANETTGTSGSLSADPNNYVGGVNGNVQNLQRIGAKAYIADAWWQILTKHLRWETELVYIYGSVENPIQVANSDYSKTDYKIRQMGAATELEYRVLNDDLKLRFYSGYASGDQGVEGLAPGNGLQSRGTTDKTISTYRFHPDYRVDLILFRNILTRVQGVYYFKPGVEYDFTKSLDGEKFGGRAEVIYSRASSPVQAPGNKADLGIELDLTLYYQSRDGSLNNDPSKLGGFYSMLQYGVLFPLGGLGYTDSQKNNAAVNVPDISSAQIVRLFLGVAY